VRIRPPAIEVNQGGISIGVFLIYERRIYYSDLLRLATSMMIEICFFLIFCHMTGMDTCNEGVCNNFFNQILKLLP
jgi:hypothetical protein